MSKCLICGEPIEQKKGKRKRVYCSDLCRLRDWQKKNRRPIGKKVEPVKPAEPKTQPQDLPLLEQLRLAETEKMPSYISSEQGRIFWQQLQRKKINGLKNKLKTP